MTVQDDGGLTRVKAALLLQLRPLIKGKSVLDVGCWNGRWSTFCIELGAASVIGIDNLAYMKEHSVDPFYGRSKKLGTDKRMVFINADAETARLPAVDFTLAFDVIYLFDNPVEWLKNQRIRTRTMLCNFIVTDYPNQPNPGYAVVKHKYSIAECQDMLQDASFKSQLVYGILDRAFFLCQ